MRIRLIKALACVLCISAICILPARGGEKSAQNFQITPGEFKPSWDSLQQYQCPEWFRDAKFGIWAHWSAQCQPEDGDWYARGMYQEGSEQYKYHLAHYGHPSKFGFKDVCNVWHAEKWD